MKRPRNSPSAAKARHLALPGFETWERWALEEGSPPVLQSSGSLAEICAQPIDWLGLPHHEVLLSPLLLKSSDPELFPSVVDLHWERQGLPSLTGSKQAGGHLPLTTTEDQSRLVAFRTAVDEPETYAHPTIRRTAPAAWMRAWPPSRLLLSRELGRTFLLITSPEARVLYQSPLFGNRPGSASLAQLRAVLQRLSDEGWLDGLTGIDVLIPLTPPELAALHDATGLPVQNASIPPPVLPPEPAAVTLPALSALHQAAQRRALLQKTLLAAGLLFILLLLAAATHAIVLSTHLASEESWLAQHQGEVARLQDIARTWAQVEDAIEPDRFVLEAFYRVTQAMPTGSVRLIRFEAKDGKLVIRGEAQNTQAAFSFLSQLQQSPDLTGYRWTMPGPNIQPNDLALFQIEGLSPYAPPSTQ
ncbi:MAG: hypothetical protein SNJ84_00905 [Verrucomicrobiia bacterium]